MTPLPHLRTPQPAPIPFRFPVWLGWIMAVVAIIIAFFMGSRLITLGTEVNLARTESEIARAEAQDFQQQLEASQIIATKRIGDLQAARVFSETTIAKLAPPQTTAPAATEPPAASAPQAILIWHATNHEGILWAESLPTPQPDEEYRLWLAETTGGWGCAGLVIVGGNGTAKTVFRTENPVALSRILVTREPRANPPTQPAGETLLIGNY